MKLMKVFRVSQITKPEPLEALGKSTFEQLFSKTAVRTRSGSVRIVMAQYRDQNLGVKNPARPRGKEPGAHPTSARATVFGASEL